MASQDSQDITQMNAGATDIPISSGTPKKSYLIWVVLACVVLGVGLGIFVYQRSLVPTKPSPTPKTTVATPKPSVTPTPIASPVTPEVSLIDVEPKAISFPKAGKLRAYYVDLNGAWMALGVIAKDASGSNTFTLASGAPPGAMKILDTGYDLLGPTSVTIDSYLNSNSSQLSVGWTKPVANQCGANGYRVNDIATYVSWATGEAKGEPIVSVQCWGDYSPTPNDTSAKDFNDYLLIWSYTPPTAGASTSPSPSASSTTASSTPTPSPSPSASSTTATTTTASPTPTPTASSRAAMPDTTDGVPVTGVFEVTVGTISVGLILLALGLVGLLAL